MKARCFVPFLLLTYAVAGYASEPDGSSDIDGVGRYPGSVIVQYEATSYDEGAFPLSANSRTDRNAFDSVVVAGPRTTVVYDVPEALNATVLGVFRSFSDGLQDAGFVVDWECVGSRDTCGFFFPRTLFPGEARTRFQSFREFTNLNGEAVNMLSAKKDAQRVILVVGKSPRSQIVQYAVDAYVLDDLETEDLVLTTEGIASDIAQAGTATLDGIYFETGSAELTDQSRDSLATIAEFLRANSDDRFLVVGHTDNVGGFGDNQQLSERRAQAVIRYLERYHDTNVGLLRSVGVGYAAPAASNATETGRLKNRRVELVFERASGE